MSVPPRLIEPIERMTMLELERAIMCVRLCRIYQDRRRMEIEERRRLHSDDEYTIDALLQVDNDLFVLTSIIIKLDTVVRKTIY